MENNIDKNSFKVEINSSYSSKYFIPTEDEFRIGYEFEFYDDDDKDWNSTIITNSIDLFNWLGFPIEKRVPYLTKYQIEQEGWIETSTKGFFDHIGDDRFYVSWYPDLNWVNIGDDENELGYAGEIKSINEFRYICKLLKI